MGKRKSTNLRISYPDSRPTVPTTNIHIHRTSSNRLGASTSINRTLEIPATPAPEDEPSAPGDDAIDNPWSQSFFTSGNDIAIDSAAVTTATAVRPPRFLDDYIRYRQNIVDHFIELDGRQGQCMCHKCVAEAGIYRCEDCLHPSLWCASCTVDQHMLTPFHRILVNL